MKVGDLYGEIDLRDDKFNQKVEGKKGLIGSLGGVVKKAAIGMGTALVGAAIAGTVSFAGFDKGMREVFTLLPGISQPAMQKMTGQVKDFAVEFGVLPKEVVPALYQALSAGVPKKNVFEFLEVAQKAAKGGVTELTTAVDGISSVVNAYGADVIDATKVSDLMFTAVKGGKTNFDELSQSLFQVIPTASALDLEFGNVTAALATMTAQGTPTRVATTQLRQALVEMSKDGGKASETFKELSGKSFKEFIAEGGNLQDALQIMEKGAKDMGVGVNDLFGSVEAGNAVLALTGAGTKKFSDELKNAESSAGATDQAFKTMSGGLADAFDKIKAAASVLLISFGQMLAPAIEAIASTILTVMPKIQAAVEGAFGVVGSVVGAVGGIFASAKRDVVAEVNEMSNESVAKVVAMAQDMERTFIELQSEGVRITGETADKIIGNAERMQEMSVAAFRENHQQSVAEIEFLRDNAGIISAAMADEMIRRSERNRDENIGNMRQMREHVEKEITTLKENGVAVTEEMRERIVEKYHRLRDGAIEALADTRVQATAVLEQLRAETGEITAEQASEVITQWARQRDGVIKEADEQYLEAVAAIVRQRDETGTITAEQATAMIEKAKEQRDGVVGETLDMYRSNVRTVTSMNSEILHEVDLFSGRLLSTWDKLVGPLRERWDATWQENKRLFGSTAADIVTRANQMMASLHRGVQSGLGEAVRLFVKSARDIRAAVADLPGWFFNLGGNIISGLISGIKSALGALWDLMTGISNKMRKFRFSPGPFELLQPAGRDIMTGLRNAIRSEMPALASTMADISRMITVAGSAEFAVSGVGRVGAIGVVSDARAGGGVVNQFITVETVEVHGLTGAKAAEEFFGSIRQVARQRPS